MLTRYKKSCEKIAMGLLSLMPSEKDLKKLRHTKRLYEENDSLQLYFWKQDEAYAGLIGVEIHEDHFIVRHISVLPPYRNDGIGQAMLEKIQFLMGDRVMHATEETEPFIQKWGREKVNAAK